MTVFFIFIQNLINYAGSDLVLLCLPTSQKGRYGLTIKKNGGYEFVPIDLLKGGARKICLNIWQMIYGVLDNQNKLK